MSSACGSENRGKLWMGVRVEGRVKDVRGVREKSNADINEKH